MPVGIEKTKVKNVSSSTMEGKPSTSKCQSSSVFDDDNPQDAIQEKPFMLGNTSYSQTCSGGRESVKTEKINGHFQS
jgi:hypothetical protein